MDEQPLAGRQAVVDSDIEPGDDVRKLAPGEIVHRNERTLGDEVLFGLQAQTSSSMPAARKSSMVRRWKCAARGSGDSAAAIMGTFSSRRLTSVSET